MTEIMLGLDLHTGFERMNIIMTHLRNTHFGHKGTGPEIIWQVRPQVFCQALTDPALSTPETGSDICDGLALFHDAADPLMRWSQIWRAPGEAGLRLTIYRFEGSFVSLAARIPDSLASKLRPGHQISVSFTARASRPLALDLRLNLEIAGRSETLAAHRILTDCAHSASFDLRHFEITGDTQVKAWCDLILRNPGMAEVDFHDLSITMHAG
ncbi:MAG: DUF6478 family protein [Pseudomonadota bacterium]